MVVFAWLIDWLMVVFDPLRQVVQRIEQTRLFYWKDFMIRLVTN